MWNNRNQFRSDWPIFSHQSGKTRAKGGYDFPALTVSTQQGNGKSLAEQDRCRSNKRLSLLLAHYALCLLKIKIAMPKLLYVLRTSLCFDNSLSKIFDDTLRRGLSLVRNVELSDKQWDQANLPMHTGDLLVRCAGMLVSSTFLVSAAAMLPRQDAILSKSVHGEEDPEVKSAIVVWSKISQSTIPSTP